MGREMQDGKGDWPGARDREGASMGSPGEPGCRVGLSHWLGMPEARAWAPSLSTTTTGASVVAALAFVGYDYGMCLSKNHQGTLKNKIYY